MPLKDFNMFLTEKIEIELQAIDEELEEVLPIVEMLLEDEDKSSFVSDASSAVVAGSTVIPRVREKVGKGLKTVKNTVKYGSYELAKQKNALDAEKKRKLEVIQKSWKNKIENAQGIKAQAALENSKLQREVSKLQKLKAADKLDDKAKSRLASLEDKLTHNKKVIQKQEGIISKYTKNKKTTMGTIKSKLSSIGKKTEGAKKAISSSVKDIGKTVAKVTKKIPGGKAGKIGAGAAAVATVGAAAYALKKIHDAKVKKRQLLNAANDNDQKERILRQIEELKQKEGKLKHKLD